jgi:hypothetical protein
MLGAGNYSELRWAGGSRNGTATSSRSTTTPKAPHADAPQPSSPAPAGRTSNARQIAALPRANYVCRSVGSRDIHADFSCTSPDELLEAALAAGSLPGVVEGELYRYAELLFANPAWA